MKLSTGKVAFPIEFDNGDSAVIYFNPNDRGIQERIKSFESSVQKRVKEIDLDKYSGRFSDKMELNFDVEDPEKLFEMSPDELNELQNRLMAVNDIEAEYNKAVRDELDVVFGSNISDVVFRYCQPFDVIVYEDEKGNENREMYIMHFIRWLMVELKKYGVENKSAVDKHVAKYVK